MKHQTLGLISYSKSVTKLVGVILSRVIKTRASNDFTMTCFVIRVFFIYLPVLSITTGCRGRYMALHKEVGPTMVTVFKIRVKSPDT